MQLHKTTLQTIEERQQHHITQYNLKTVLKINTTQPSY